MESRVPLASISARAGTARTASAIRESKAVRAIVWRITWGTPFRGPHLGRGSEWLARRLPPGRDEPDWGTADTRLSKVILGTSAAALHTRWTKAGTLGGSAVGARTGPCSSSRHADPLLLADLAPRRQPLA